MSATDPATLQGVSPGKLRRELETLVVNDLLGPVEEVDEKTPRTDRYLFGKLASRDQDFEILFRRDRRSFYDRAREFEEGLCDATAAIAITVMFLNALCGIVGEECRG